MGTPQAAIRRVRCNAAESTPARRALERWLASLDLTRYGLPPTAILLVRHVRAPLRALAPETANDPLAAALHHAARPARDGFVPAGAGAVWFADEAELLACMARDVVAGIAGAHWWWTVALGHAPDAPAVLRRWLAAARTVPAALAAVPGDWPRRWLVGLGTEGRARLLEALAHEFPVGEAARRAVLAHDLPAPADAAGAFDMTAPVADRRPPPVGDAPPLAPPDAAAALMALCETLAAQPLAALDDALAAVLAPAVPNRANSANERIVVTAERWPVDSVHGRAAPLPAAHPGGAPIERARDATPSAVGRDAVPPGAVTADGAAPAAPSTAPRQRRLVRRVGEQRVRASTSPADAASVGSRPDDAVAATASPRTHGRPPSQPLPAASATSTLVDTNHAGLFFLLNAAIALGLYGDFTQPRHAGLAVSPWRFLHGAGSVFFGRRFLSDPLAAWLSARAPSPAPRQSPARWCADAMALQALAGSSGRWHAVVAPGALVLRHPAGFTAAWSSGDSEDVLSGLCAEVGAAPQSVVVHHRRRPMHLPRDAVQSYTPLLAARLALALGMPARPACALALVLPGRVRAGAQRIDVDIALSSLPLAVRLAGLDRDPGWLPAAGCDIRFHFD